MTKRMALFLGVFLTAMTWFTSTYPMPAQDKKADPYKDFRPCKEDEMPFTKDVPPPFPRFESMQGCRFQWHCNPRTGEFLYRNLGKHNAKLTIEVCRQLSQVGTQARPATFSGCYHDR